jgi:hypothetical protein
MAHSTQLQSQEILHGRLGLVAQSACMTSLLQEAYKAAYVGNITLLIEGETGTGKQVLAQANAETLVDAQVYKPMSLLDTFPIGDPEVLIFLKSQYPNVPFVSNDEIKLVLARNIASYFNSLQQALIPQ